MQIARVRFSFLICILLFVLTKCGDLASDSVSKVEDGISTEDSTLAVFMQNFALPFSKNIKSDSDLLVFYCSRPYDTSSLIMLKREKNFVFGVYYQTLPEYHRFI